MQQSRSIKNLSRILKKLPDVEPSNDFGFRVETCAKKRRLLFLEVVKEALENMGATYEIEQVSKGDGDDLEVGASVMITHRASGEWIKTPDLTIPVKILIDKENPTKDCVEICAAITLANLLLRK